MTAKKTKLYLEEEKKKQMIKFKEWKMVCVAPFFVKVLLKRKIPHLPTTCNNWCRIRQRQMREEIQRVFLWLWAICLSCRHNTVKQAQSMTIYSTYRIRAYRSPGFYFPFRVFGWASNQIYHTWASNRAGLLLIWASFNNGMYTFLS